MKIEKSVAFTCAALALQVAAVGWLVWRYERIVQNGTEVRLRCQAYDPYDPLRGRYLRMTVREECSNILFDMSDVSECREFGDVFVKLAEAPDTDGLWRVEAVALEPADGGLWARPKSVRMAYCLEYNDKKDDESYSDFYERREHSGRKAVVTFPDQLFVNEKIAPAAEKVLRRAEAGSAVAVYRVHDGKIVLTGIEIDGRSVQSATREAMDGGQSAE